MKLRWNSDEKVWEFEEHAWGGWCTLRETPSGTSRPMTYEQGMLYAASKLHQIRAGLRPEIVRYEDTKAEPTRVGGADANG